MSDYRMNPPQTTMFLPQPTQSYHPIPSQPTSHLLQLISDCVRETENCVSHANNSIAALQPGVEDLPRLSVILQNQRRYLFVPEPLVESHKQRLAKEVEPQIDQLIARADKGLSTMERREVALKRKLALLEKQPKTNTASSTMNQPRSTQGPRPTVAEERKLAMLKGKREKLRQQIEEMERAQDLVHLEP